MREKKYNSVNENQENISSLNYNELICKNSKKELYELLWINLPKNYDTIFEFLEKKGFDNAFEEIEKKFPSLSSEERYKLANTLAKILQFDKLQEENILTATEQRFLNLITYWISLINGFDFLVDDEQINRYFASFNFEERMKIKYIINAYKILGRWYDLPLPLEKEDYYFINLVMFNSNQSLTTWIETN